jgi:hypothetical protein
MAAGNFRIRWITINRDTEPPQYGLCWLKKRSFIVCSALIRPGTIRYLRKTLYTVLTSLYQSTTQGNPYTLELKICYLMKGISWSDAWLRTAYRNFYTLELKLKAGNVMIRWTTINRLRERLHTWVKNTPLKSKELHYHVTTQKPLKEYLAERQTNGKTCTKRLVTNISTTPSSWYLQS